MSKILMWLLLAFIVMYVVRNKGRARENAARKAAEARGAGPARAAPAQVEAMVACARCELHLPQSEALQNPAGQLFCSDEHLRLGAR